MLKINHISITHFKNYESGIYSFGKVVGICGLNGVGKTNLLDAIYYCCFTRSYFSPTENLNTQFERLGFRIQANFELNGEVQEVTCIYRGNNKKEIYVNEVPYEKFSKHIGVLTIVMIAPDDAELITGGSEKRRKFIDTLLCQADYEYLESLIVYNKLLQQRNSLLRNSGISSQLELLDIIDQQMIAPGTLIFEKRKSFMLDLGPMTEKFYGKITGPNEIVSLEYESALKEQSYSTLLASARGKDMMLQRSTAGIHKDDIGLSLNGQVFRHIASQGQRKSLLFALKMAEYEILKQQKGFAPILLLDDAFEKLDDNRMYNLLKWVCKDNEGQVFITDTHEDRLKEVFDKLNVEGQVIVLK